MFSYLALLLGFQPLLPLAYAATCINPGASADDLFNILPYLSNNINSICSSISASQVSVTESEGEGLAATVFGVFMDDGDTLSYDVCTSAYSNIAEQCVETASNLGGYYVWDDQVWAFVNVGAAPSTTSTSFTSTSTTTVGPSDTLTYTSPYDTSMTSTSYMSAAPFAAASPVVVRGGAASDAAAFQTDVPVVIYVQTTVETVYETADGGKIPYPQKVQGITGDGIEGGYRDGGYGGSGGGGGGACKRSLRRGLRAREDEGC